MRLQIGAVLALVLTGAGCGAANPNPVAASTESDAPDAPEVVSTEPIQRGKATWYGGRFHGRKTASGERFDKRKLTAAHRKLPFGTLVRVVNELNGAEVTVRINDRGPYGKGRIIDVSEAAAKKLDMIAKGVVPVTVQVLRRP